MEQKEIQTLLDVYENYTKEELIMIAKLHHMKGCSKYKKAELASKVRDYLLSEEEMSRYFLCLKDEEAEKFVSAASELIKIREDYDGYFDYLFAGGYCAVREDMTVFVPEDVKKAYEQINTEEFRKKRARVYAIGNYCHAANNLYAVTPLEIMVEFFNKYETEKTDEKEVMEVYEILSRYRCDFKYIDGLFVDLGLIPDEKYKDLYKKQQNSPFYFPCREEVENLAVYDQMEITRELARVMQYLQKVKHAEIDVIAEACSVIQIVIRKGGGIEDIFGILEEGGISFQDEEEVQEFMPLLVDLWNHSRMVLNRGYSPAEMQEIEKENA